MAESWEEAKIFSGYGEEREKDALEDIDMAKLREAASAHYNGLTDDQKEEVTRLFNTMDKNEDGNISVDEFKTFLSVAGLQTVNPDGLFAKLDKDDSKILSFEELIIFFYVLSHDEYKHILEGRPSTNAPGQKGHKWTKIIPRLYDKFKGTYKLEEWVSEGWSMRWSTGDFIGLYHKFKGCEQA